MIGSRIDANPGPMLMIQPTLAMADAWSKDRLAPMLRDTPRLRGKVRDARARDSGNQVLHKQFPAGHITMAGANSPASLASRPIRDVFFDEEDRYAATAGNEGDPVKLAETRTRAFWNSKKVHISSPGLRGASRIEIVWSRSDQRYYYVPCHACGVLQTLKWSQVSWDKDETGEHRPETASYVCEACGEKWSDVQRRAAVKRGEWIATKPFRGCAGFHVNALYAPWESCNLNKLVEQWLEARGNPALLQVFVNTVLAEWWEDDHAAKTLDPTGMLPRREELPECNGRPVIPAPVAVLTAGVDVQDNRLEGSVYGWGAGEESWLLLHHVLYGDPARPELWAALDAWLLHPFPRALGGADFIRGICMDSGGHHTQAVYEFARDRYRRFTPDGGQQMLFATKGYSGAGELWPTKASRQVTAALLWPLKVDAGKSQIYNRLGNLEPGPGYIHFPMTVDQAFFEGLTAEKLVPGRDKRGFPTLTWKLRRESIANEPLDCAVLAYSALHGLRANGYDLESECRNMAARVVWTPPEIGTPESAVRAPKIEREREQRRPDAGGWLGDTSGWLRR